MTYQLVSSVYVAVVPQRMLKLATDPFAYMSVSLRLSVAVVVVRRLQLRSVSPAETTEVYVAMACAFAVVAVADALAAVAAAAVYAEGSVAAAAVLVLLLVLGSSCQACTDPACQAGPAAEHTEAALSAAGQVESQAYLDSLAAWLG